MRTKLKYVQRLTFTSTLGVSNVRVLSLNGLFDVDITGVGGQPEGFDEWMAFYGAYRVVSSRARIRASSSGATAAASGFWMILVPTATITTYATMADADAAPFSVSKVSVQGAPAVTLERTLTMATSVGVPPEAILNESGFSGTASANPAGASFWQLYIESSDVASTVVTSTVIEIDFLVDFYDRNNRAISANCDLKNKLLAQKKEAKRLLTPKD
jgi:hypothetical protein